jgi:hypothetical protein
MPAYAGMTGFKPFITLAKNIFYVFVPRCVEETADVCVGIRRNDGVGCSAIIMAHIA